MDDIAFCISLKGRNIQYFYNIGIFIGNRNGIIFKSLIGSIRPGTDKYKHLRFPGKCHICYEVLSLPYLILEIFL